MAHTAWIVPSVVLRRGHPFGRSAEQLLVAVRQVFSQEALTFQDKIVSRAGLGDETYLPEGVSTATQKAVAPCLHQHAQSMCCHAPFCTLRLAPLRVLIAG